jgi:hypothetical protein
MPSNHCLPSILLATIVMFGACSSGGGSSEVAEIAPQPSASVPDGTGIVTIQMTGLWQIRNAVVIDSNSANPVAPLNGTTFWIEPGAILEIDGMSVSPDSLSELFGADPDPYVNEVDGLTLMYQVVVDRRATGGTREECALAGGAFDVDSISVEAFSSSQSPTDSQPVYTLVRYTLFRQSTTDSVVLADELPPSQADQTVQQVFGKAFGWR